jgi:hypothetical protein
VQCCSDRQKAACSRSKYALPLTPVLPPSPGAVHRLVQRSIKIQNITSLRNIATRGQSGLLPRPWATARGCIPPDSCNCSVNPPPTMWENEGSRPAQREVSPSRAYDRPHVAARPGGERPTSQKVCNRIQGGGTTPRRAVIVSRHYGLPSSSLDTNSYSTVGWTS